MNGQMVTVNFASLCSIGQRSQPQSNEPEGATDAVRIATTLSGREIFPSEPSALGSTSPVGPLCQEQYAARGLQIGSPLQQIVHYMRGASAAVGQMGGRSRAKIQLSSISGRL